MGRPKSAELTEDLIARTKKLLAFDGLYRQDAAWLLGINPNTFDSWLKQGRQPDRDPDDLFVVFAEAVQTAEAELKQTGQAKARAEKGGEKWFLQCRFPRQYNPDLRRELAAAFDEIFGCCAATLGPEAAATLMDALGSNEEWADLLPKMKSS